MSVLGVNLWAVLAAGVAAMIVGFLWYSPLLFAKPWMALMGYDPSDKAKTEELQKGAGKLYAISFVASLVTAFVLGKVIHISTVNTALYGAKIGAAPLAGIRGYGPAHRRPVCQEAGETLSDQYRLSVGVLPDDGGNPRDVAAVAAGSRPWAPRARRADHSGKADGPCYSVTIPPVRSRRRSMRCSTDHAVSSSTIFSVARGSQ